MSAPLLHADTIERFLTALPGLTIAVLGDLYLDRYLDLDARLTEPSLETGLDAYQVVRIRDYPGAAGTIINNLAALGVGRIMPLSIIGNDGEGYELRQALAELPAVEPSGILSWPGRRTPTYTKPMLQQPGQPARELNRLDIHNRQPLPDEAQEQLLELLDAAWTEIHAIMILDQVRQPDCGVVTARVRDWLAGNSARWPRRWMLADSRERIGLFRGVCLKPNASECRRATGVEDTATAAQVLAQRTGRPVFCTEGERGMVLAEPGQPSQWIPGYAVTGPVDPVGAGDSCNAALLAALAAGLSLTEAAALGNLVASITVQQLGTTGTASPTQVRQRFQEVKIL